MADTLIREQISFQSQPLAPVPQYWNADTMAYEKVEGESGAIRTLLPVVGTHANAWNAVSVAAGGNSNVVDTKYQSNISVFGNASAATTITAYVSQDGTNFYKTANEVALSAARDFHFSFVTGARYIRLKSSAAATITATIAGK